MKVVSYLKRIEYYTDKGMEMLAQQMVGESVVIKNIIVGKVTKAKVDKEFNIEYEYQIFPQ